MTNRIAHITPAASRQAALSSSMRDTQVTDQLRRRIAEDAARRMLSHHDTGYLQAKRAAARQLAPDGIRPFDLPTDAEVREELEALVAAGGASAMPSMNAAPAVDRFRHFQLLMQPLEKVQQSRKTQPEGDVLYHSLQVFDLARAELPYDEEFLLAALLHDVGKGISPENHVVAGLEALEGLISERTAWLIAHHPDAQALREGKLGMRSERRLQTSEDFEELMLLAKCDRHGRKVGVPVPDLEDALGYLRDLEKDCGDPWTADELESESENA